MHALTRRLAPPHAPSRAPRSTTVFSHSQSVVLCGSCSTVLCTPTGGRARLTEGERLRVAAACGARVARQPRRALGATAPEVPRCQQAAPAALTQRGKRWSRPRPVAGCSFRRKGD